MDCSSEINKLRQELSTIITRLEALEANVSTNTTNEVVGGVNKNTKPTTTNTTTNTKTFDNKVYLWTSDSFHYISGNTYNIRSLLKEKAAKWDGPNKCWKINSDKLELSGIYQMITSQGISTVYRDGDERKCKDMAKNKGNNKNKVPTPVKQPNSPSNGVGFAMLSDSDSES